MKKRQSGCGLIAGVCLILMISTGLIVYPHAKAVSDSVNRLRGTVNELNDMVKKRDLDMNTYKEKIAAAHSDIDLIQAEVSPYYGWLKKASSLPRIGVYAGQVEPIIEAADQTLLAIEELLPVLILPTGNTVSGEKSLPLVRKVNENQSGIKSAIAYIQKAESQIDQVDGNLWPEEYQKKIQNLKEILAGLNKAASTLTLIPRMTGEDRPVTYLIMVQNSDELRATGGFVTAFGLLRFEKGQITILDFQDSSFNYISERIEAPLPLKWILFAHYWLPRDANWYPSFPESAKKVQELYFLSTGIKTDGVIAVHQSTLRKVLEFTGPVTVSGETVTKDNVEDFMISEKMEALSAKKFKERKNFIKPLFSAILTKFTEMMDVNHLTGGIRLIKTLVLEGDILCMSNDAEIQAMIKSWQVDGGLAGSQQDYLMLVDSNLGYNKLDKLIKRRLTYSVDLSNPQKPVSKVEMTYENPFRGSVNCIQGSTPEQKSQMVYMKPACYWDYWRIIRNKGTTLSAFNVPELDPSLFLSSQAWSPNPGEETEPGDFHEVNGLVIVPAESERSVRLDENLPEYVLSSDSIKTTYSLTFQKQPGIDSLPVKIYIKIPANARFVSSEPEFYMSRSKNEWAFEGNFEQSINTLTFSYSIH
ncbi:hypothetical protein LTAR_03308 [Leptolinea tardivitalis]|nr:hypothetical protein LTAR_03308 [Leptolinea tardivitalis]